MGVMTLLNVRNEHYPVCPGTHLLIFCPIPSSLQLFAYSSLIQVKQLAVSVSSDGSMCFESALIVADEVSLFSTSSSFVCEFTRTQLKTVSSSSQLLAYAHKGS